MNVEDKTVKDDMVVTLEYTVRLADGEVVDSTEGEEPLEVLQGFGQVVPGLEEALYGMKVGQVKEIVVEPEDGYGVVDDEGYQMVPADLFPDDLELEAGMVLEMEDGESGDIVEATVSEIGPAGVLLDFNHPLAGERLFFRVTVVGLRDATDEELEHGHVHDLSHGH
jgi:FKBP-type peptidyl-prolyl cis-trans isomerase SlyD